MAAKFNAIITPFVIKEEGNDKAQESFIVTDRGKCAFQTAQCQSEIVFAFGHFFGAFFSFNHINNGIEESKK